MIWSSSWSPVLRSRLRERVLVTTKNGTTYDGVFYEGDSRTLVLRNAAAVGADADKNDLPLDGEIILLLSDVDFIQRP